MRKDTTIFSELQEFFQQNDAHKAINRISNVMNSLKLHKNKIGIEKAENSRYTTIQILYIDITGYQLLVVSAVEKWSIFSLKTESKLYFNEFNFYKPQQSKKCASFVLTILLTRDGLNVCVLGSYYAEYLLTSVKKRIHI